MGTRPLCYANPGGVLIFGSDAELVAAHPQVGRRLSHQAVFDYLYSHVVPSPRTIYEGVQKLEPGECATFRNGTVERRFYWQLLYRDQTREDLAELEQRFLDLLRQSVHRAIGADSNVGAFLSGGTDSSTVVGMLAEVTGRAPCTYSIGFAAEGFDEMSFARTSATSVFAPAKSIGIFSDRPPRATASYTGIFNGLPKADAGSRAA
jgi:asparagine synthase (glutamine-hydrolysing)